VDMAAERIAGIIAAEIGARPAKVIAAAELLDGGASARADTKSLELTFMAHGPRSRSRGRTAGVPRNLPLGRHEGLTLSRRITVRSGRHLSVPLSWLRI
jgi:hypothetical protein